MDPGRVVESQHFNPKVQENNSKEYYTNTSYLDRFGTQTASRLPRRNWALPIIGNRPYQQAVRPLNIKANRYLLPGGLQYRLRDLYGVYNSAPKSAPGYVDQVIEANPGTVWGSQ